MVGVIISLLVTIFVVKVLLKKMKAQFVLLFGGLILLTAAVIMDMCGLLPGGAQILPKGVKSTGFVGFDLFKAISSLMSSRLAGIGLLIMSAAGYSKYMSMIGASAIMADVGGDTSHAAITSRELGIAAVIGIQRLDVLRALDGVEVTVDGTRGRVYRGLLPLREVGGEMDVAKLPTTKTKVGLVLADVGQALFLSRLREFPQFEVGLLRAEFMLGNISIHPQALEAFDNGELEDVVQGKLKELEDNLSKVLRADGCRPHRVQLQPA